jgi:hypothetical protein
MNSYELLQKLTNDLSEIYLPKARLSLDPMECDDRIQWNSDRDEYMKTSFKMTPQSLVISLLEKAYDLGRESGYNQKTSEIRNALGLQ